MKTSIRGSTVQHPAGRRSHFHHALLVLLGFAISTASFVGATIFADARLEAVARSSHDVSENAMPSLIELGAMRRALLGLKFALEETAEGAVGDAEEASEEPGALEELGALQDAQRRYEALPQFPGEPELSDRMRAHVGKLRSISGLIGERVAARDFGTAKAQVTRDLIPAARMADDDLAALIALNEQQGRLAAATADAALSRTRQLSAILDLICVGITAGLALAAYRALRDYARANARRTEELEGFAARIAHDIRSPLQPAVFALGAVIRRLRKTEPGGGDPLQSTVERGVHGLRRVDELVGDLLAFAQSGAVPEPGASAPVKDVVRGILLDLEPQAASHRIELHAEELPADAMACTSGVLASIVLNLVNNAIQHFPSEKEPRRILVRGITEGARVRVEVADTGAGLMPTALSRVFELYVRLDKSRPGLGLGLATVKRLVESYGGAVGVRSREGEGATFWFELPRVEPDVTRAPVAAKRDPARDVC